MPTIENTIIINAPVEKVFEALDSPERIPEFFPGIVAVTDVATTDKRIGDTVTLTYSVLGLHLSVKGTVLEREPGRRLAHRLEGPISGVTTIALESVEGGVRVTDRYEYSMGAGVLGKVVNILLLERINEKNTQRFLENLKLICEAEADVVA